MKEDTEDRFERFWKNIEPALSKKNGLAEIRLLRYAVKLGYEAGRQSLLRDLYDYLRQASGVGFHKAAPEPEPA